MFGNRWLSLGFRDSCSRWFRFNYLVIGNGSFIAKHRRYGDFLPSVEIAVWKWLRRDWHTVDADLKARRKILDVRKSTVTTRRVASFLISSKMYSLLRRARFLYYFFVSHSRVKNDSRVNLTPFVLIWWHLAAACLFASLFSRIENDWRWFRAGIFSVMKLPFVGSCVIGLVLKWTVTFHWNVEARFASISVRLAIGKKPSCDFEECECVNKKPTPAITPSLPYISRLNGVSAEYPYNSILADRYGWVWYR